MKVRDDINDSWIINEQTLYHRGQQWEYKDRKTVAVTEKEPEAMGSA